LTVALSDRIGHRLPGKAAADKLRPMRAHDIAAETSRALHVAVADRLRVDPGIVARAQTRVGGWLQDGSVARPYAEAWCVLLSGPVETLIAALSETSERMHDLRHVSPFAGVISAQERWRIRDQVKSEFDREPRSA
jgi:hypothetical protein